MGERMHTYKDHPEISKYYQDSIDILASLLNDFQEEYILNEFIKAEEKIASSNEAFCEAYEKLSKTSAQESFKNQAEWHKLLVKWLKELQGRRRYDKEDKCKEYYKSIIRAQKELEECRRSENNTSNEINEEESKVKSDKSPYNFYDDLKDKALNETDDKDNDPNKIDLNVIRLVRPRDCPNCLYFNINDSHCYSCCKKLENNFKPKVNECKYCLFYNMNDGHCGPCKKGIKNNYKIISSFIDFEKCKSCSNCHDSCLDRNFCYDCISGIKDKYDPVDKDNKEGDNEC